MIQVGADKLVDFIIETLWCFDQYGDYYSNTKIYLEDMIKDNALGLSREDLERLNRAVKERLEKGE